MGCFRRIFYLITGMVLGVVLFVGTIVGAGYFVATQVTVSKVEQVAEKTFIQNEEATIKDMTILDLINYLSASGTISNMSVEEFYNFSGVDLIKVLETQLNVTIEEGPEKDALRKTPLLNVTESLDALTNALTLNFIQTMFPSLQLPDLPIIQDNMDESIIAVINAIMEKLDLDNLTITDLEEMLGFDASAQFLQSIKNTPINALSETIQTISLGSFIPDFDRDLYMDTYDGAEYVYAYVPIEFTSAYVEIVPGDTVDASARYSYSEKYSRYVSDETGTYKRAIRYVLIKEGETVEEANRYSYDSLTSKYVQSNSGIYTTDTVTNYDLYKRSGTVGNYTYEQNKYGDYMVSDGTRPGERYSLKDGAYVEDRAGTYKAAYIPATAENSVGKVVYVFRYVDCVVETETAGTFELDSRDYIEKNSFEAASTAKYAGKYRKNGTTWEINEGTSESPSWVVATRYNVVTTSSEEGGVTVYKNELIESTTGRYALVHTGSSEQILKTLADTSITGIKDKIGTLTIADVMEVVPDEYVEVSAAELPATADDVAWDAAVTVSVSDGIESSVYKKELFVRILGDGLYYHFDYNDHNSAVAAAGTTYWLRTFKSNTHIAIKQLANVPITDIGNKMTDVVNSLYVSDIMTIHEEYYEDANGTHVNTGTPTSPVWVRYDAAVHGTSVTRYNEPSSKLICSIGSTPVSKLADKIDDMKLNEIIDIIDQNTYEAVAEADADADTYGVIARVSVVGDNVVEATAGVLAAVDADKTLLEQVKEFYIGTYEYETASENGVIKVLAKFANRDNGTPRGTFYDKNGEAEKDLFKIIEKRSSGALVSLSGLTVSELSGGIQSTMDSLTLKEVISLDGDVYLKVYAATYAEAEAVLGAGNVYGCTDGIFNLAEVGGSETEFYQRVYEGENNVVLKKLANTAVQDLGGKMKNVIDTTKLNEIIDIIDENVYVTSDDDDLTDYNAAEAAGKQKYGVAIVVTGTRAERDEKLLNYFGAFNVYKDAVDGEDWILTPDAAGKTYVSDKPMVIVKTAKSSGALVAAGNLTVGNMGSEMQNCIDDMMLKDVMSIDGNIYEKLEAASFAAAEVEAAGDVYVDKDSIFSLIEVDDPAFTVYYKLAYEGNGHIIMKKLANVKVSELGNKMETIINDTRLKEIIDIVEENVYVTDADEGYATAEPTIYRAIAIVDTEAELSGFYGTYQIWKNSVNNPTPDGKFWVLAEEQTGVTYANITKVKIFELQSSGVLVALADCSVSSLGTEMTNAVDKALLNDVMNIDGDVFMKFAATTYAEATTEAISISYGGKIYVCDADMFRPFDEYYRDDAGNYVCVASVWTLYDADNSAHDGLKRYNKTDDFVTANADVTGYYYRIYSGADNVILKKLSTVTVKEMPDRIAFAVNESSLLELGVVTESTTGILGNDKIKNSSISELPDTITEVMEGATLRELNEWGNLGISDSVVIYLNVANAPAGTYATPPTTLAELDPQYDITAAEFFSGIRIDNTDPLDPKIVYDPS